MLRSTQLVVVLTVAVCVSSCTSSTQAPEPEVAGVAAPRGEEPARSAVQARTEPAPTMPSWTLPKLSQGAKLLGDLGEVRRAVTTRSREAQSYFDQGLALTYGFNHDEAARSFAKAAELDPSCAMCFWGAAYTLGPNYNIPMLPDRARAAFEAINLAQEESKHATLVEQALIGALAKRYKGPEYLDPAGMQPYNEAYAAAMRDVAKQFPDDLDVQTLFAEAAMNIHPWKLWTPEGSPVQGTEEIVSTLESVLRRDPNHAGANHYYVHAVEASKHPERAEQAADRLGKLVPGAGHLVHMPAHIYQRVGRYEDASEANRRAIVADQNYLEKVTPPGYYPFYMGHNYGFLAYSSSMQGKSADSIAAAKKAAKTIPKDVVCGMPGMDFFLAEPLLVMVRFGRWDDLLAEPPPDAKYQVLTALYHHAQGMALAAKGRVDAAKERVTAIRKVASALPPELVAGLNNGKALLEVAAKAVEGRIADAEKRPDAVAIWTETVGLEDKLAYAEPADWFYPTRHYLGAALLDAGKAKEAEAVYRKDLEINPKNGWALFGVWKSLEAQKQGMKAKAAKKDFDEAWKSADITLARTAY